VRTQAAVDALAGCRVMGELVIGGPEVRDLSPLRSLERVDGMITMFETIAIRDLSGFSGLRSAMGLQLLGNTALESLAGLSLLELTGATPGILVGGPAFVSLEGIQSLSMQSNVSIVVSGAPHFSDLSPLSGFQSFGAVQLLDLPALGSLQALANVTSIGVFVLSDVQRITSLTELAALTELDDLLVLRSGLKSFAGLERIRRLHSLTVSENSELDARVGLPALELVEDEVLFEKNPSLTTFAGLAGLKSALALRIAHNAALPTLASLSSLTRVDGNVTVIHNDSLPDSDVARWASGVTIGGRLKFGANAEPLPAGGACPWAEDGECDYGIYLDLCTFEADFKDCCTYPPTCRPPWG
jgi:hypothetical protein